MAFKLRCEQASWVEPSQVGEERTESIFFPDPARLKSSVPININIGIGHTTQVDRMLRRKDWKFCAAMWCAPSIVCALLSVHLCLNVRSRCRKIHTNLVLLQRGQHPLPPLPLRLYLPNRSHRWFACCRIQLWEQFFILCVVSGGEYYFLLEKLARIGVHPKLTLDICLQILQNSVDLLSSQFKRTYFYWAGFWWVLHSL